MGVELCNRVTSNAKTYSHTPTEAHLSFCFLLTHTYPGLAAELQAEGGPVCVKESKSLALPCHY